MPRNSSKKLFPTSRPNTNGQARVEICEARVLLSATASTLTPLHTFTGGADGANPTIVGLDAAGDIFGVTTGGTDASGTVFEITADGTFHTLQSFPAGSDAPTSIGVVDSAGDFFDTTFNSSTQGGTLFEIPANATITTLHTFAGGSDATPSLLLVDHSGNLFGTTYDSNANAGAIFEIPAGTHNFVPIHTFTTADGFSTNSLVVDPQGNLFGVTTGDATTSLGEVFMIPAGTTTLNVIQSYAVGTSDNLQPGSLLIVDAAGNVFGETLGTMDFSSQDSGTAFEIPAGTSNFQTISSFQSQPVLVGTDAAGNLYGVSYATGGISYNSAGNLFEIPAGSTSAIIGASVSSSDNEVVDPQGNVFVYGADPLSEVPAGGTTVIPLNLNIPAGSLIQPPVVNARGNLVLTISGDGTTTFGELDELTVGTLSTTHLAFIDQPGNAPPGNLPSIAVAIEDASGHIITSDNSAVTLALNGASTLGGRATAIAVNGVATFSDLSIADTGQFSFAAADGDDTPATSNTFTIDANFPPPVVASVAGAVLPASAVAGQAFKVRVPVAITNTSGNLKGKFTINLYANTSPTLDGNQTLLSPVKRTLSLKADKAKGLTIALKSLPRTLVDGAYFLLAEVIAPNGATDVASTLGTVQVAAPLVSLTATLGTVTPTPLALGKTGSVLVTVTNNGNIDAVGLLDLTLGVSSDGATPLSGITLKDLKARPRIKPGKTVKFTLRFRRSSALSAGVYYPTISGSTVENSTTTVGNAPFTAA